jgi:Domain of unknown function (DUF4184)
MPFTPFHMGAACAVKAVTGETFSLMVFGFAQVAMDIEPLYHLLRGEGIYHGFSHTLLGASLIALGAILLGRPLCQLLLNVWTPDPADAFLTWLRGKHGISWKATILAAAIGTYSHVLLDSLVSGDVYPFAPFASASPLYGLVSMEALYLLLLGTGILGIMGMIVVYMVESAHQ